MERVHIICGFCGSRNNFTFSFVYNSDTKRKDVHLKCKNCSTLTGLDEIIKEEN